MKSKLLQRATVIGSVIIMSAIGLLVAAAPANASYGNPACPISQPPVSPSVTLRAFAYHDVIVRAPVCKLLGPLVGYIYVGDPAVSLPTTFPGGGILEQVDVTQGPTLVVASSRQVTYRYTIKQTVFRVGGSQNFVFDTSYEISGFTYRVHTCFINGGSACSNWVNF